LTAQIAGLNNKKQRLFMKEVIYLTKEEIQNINKKYMRESNETHHITSEGNLEEAINGPKKYFMGHELNATIGEKVFVIANSIARGHAFGEGNKRTATECVEIFLKKNGYEVNYYENLRSLIDLTVNYSGEDMEKLKAHFVIGLNRICGEIPVPIEYQNPEPLITPPTSPVESKSCKEWFSTTLSSSCALDSGDAVESLGDVMA